MVFRSRGRALSRALLILFAGAIAAQLLHQAVARELVKVEAPDFALKSTSGSNHRLSEYRSEVVALAFWASWCGDCRQQLPALQRLQLGLAADGLQVLSVNLDKDARAAAQATADLDVTIPVLFDAGGEVARLYDLRTLPVVVLIDREGRIRSTHEGEAGTEQKLAQEIRGLLAE
jgi:peroxiredoxin